MPKALSDLLSYLNVGVFGLAGIAGWAFYIKYRALKQEAMNRKVKDDLQSITDTNRDLSLQQLVDKVNRRRNRK